MTKGRFSTRIVSTKFVLGRLMVTPGAFQQSA